jgi:small-conductance mechanosensitive channel
VTRALAIVAAALSIALPTVAAAQQPAPAAPTSASTARQSAPDTAVLVVQGRPVFVFRGALGAVNAAERAAAARRRIDDFLASNGEVVVSERRAPEGTIVLLGGRPVFAISPADIDTASGETLVTTSEGVLLRMRDALAGATSERSFRYLLEGILLAIGATLLFLLVLRALVWARARALAKIPATSVRRFPQLTIRGFTIVSTASILRFLRRLLDFAFWALGLFAAYLWLAYVLTRFVYSRPWGEALGNYLAVTVSSLAIGAVSAVPGIFTVVLIVVAARWLTRLIAGFFDAVEAGNVQVGWIHPETANATKRIVLALLWLFAIVAIYPYLPGSGSEVFKGVTVFAGLVVSLGSTGIVNQGMSGLVLMYSRALKAGDYVRIGAIEGTVTTLGMLSTKIRSTKNEEITIPNAVVVGTDVLNFTRLQASGGVALHTAVTIGYDTPWRQVQGLLVLAAERTPGIRKEPAPFVLQTALSDFYVEYELRAYMEHPERRIATLSALNANIVDAFNEFGVQIMSPHYRNDPEMPKVVPVGHWHDAPARGAPPLGTVPGRDGAAAAEGPGHRAQGQGAD